MLLSNLVRVTRFSQGSRPRGHCRLAGVLSAHLHRPSSQAELDQERRRTVRVAADGLFIFLLAAQGLWAGQPALQVESGSLQRASQVAAVQVHSRLGLAVLQRVGTAHWDAVQSTPIGRLSAADAAAARQLLSLRVLRLDGPARGPAVSPLHTGLHFWAGQGAR